MELKRVGFVDIDGVIADATERFKLCTLPDGKINWGEALSDKHLHLDTLIEGAIEHLQALIAQCDKVYFLTSRYDHMEQETLLWMQAHKVPTLPIITKPWETERFTKTKVWKARQVLKLAKEEQSTDIVVIDDEEQNLKEIKQVVGLNHPARLRVYFSLAEAAEGESNPQTEEIPAVVPATEQQMSSIKLLCQYLQKPVPESLGYLEAKQLIQQLTSDYREMRAQRKGIIE